MLSFLSFVSMSVTLNFTAEISGQEAIATHPLISYVSASGELHGAQGAVLSACGYYRREEKEQDPPAGGRQGHCTPCCAISGRKIPVNRDTGMLIAKIQTGGGRGLQVFSQTFSVVRISQLTLEGLSSGANLPSGRSLQIPPAWCNSDWSKD